MKSLFELLSTEKFAANSKAAKILKAGANMHSEVELAKAVTTTKAYKDYRSVQEAVENVLTNAAAAEKPAPEPEKTVTNRNGENCRRSY